MNRIETHTDDARLGEIVDEVLSRMANGESIDLDQYAAEHPDVAKVLRHAIPALHAVTQSDCQTGGDESNPAGIDRADSSDRVLGDFRISRELGRGGMGVVYEADQISLGRKVALKVLPFAGMAQGNALQRFHNEVRAAASLDHPNIVSVYSVGEERGVHYYAMQLVRGESLAEVIAQLSRLQRDGQSLASDSISKVLSGVTVRASTSGTDPTEAMPPAAESKADTKPVAKADVTTNKSPSHDREFYRSVARLAVQAADALQHAHEHGVIHRDIKPGNLMLDANAELYVTDFGLARIESDTAMTMTGDLIGTLRYMSPEQALAKRVVVDHRADLYSLGMTLYEMLTLRPAFTATDRQVLLKQIAFEEPVKPRKLSRAIPHDLETILLKSIEKNPNDRYATASEMAEDLRGFLSDRPIAAKRPSITQRVTKWSRRHRTLVSTAAITVAIAITVSGVLLWRERSQTLAALAQANEKQELANQVVDRFYREYAFEAKQESGKTPVRREFLEAAADYFEEQIGSEWSDHEIRFKHAVTFDALGRLYNDLQLYDEADQAFRRSITSFEQSLVEASEKQEPTFQLVTALLGYGLALQKRRENEQAERILGKAATVLSPLLRTSQPSPTLLHLRSRVNFRRGFSLALLGKRQEAEPLIRKAIATHELLIGGEAQGTLDSEARTHVRVTAAAAYHALTFAASDVNEREQCLRRAIGISEQLVLEDPGNHTRRNGLALYLRSCARVIDRQGNSRDDEAEELYQRAIQIYLALVNSQPGVTQYRTEMFEAAMDLVRMHQSNGRLQHAANCLNDLINESPFAVPMLVVLRSNALRMAGKPTEALRDLDTAIPQLELLSKTSSRGSVLAQGKLLSSAYQWQATILEDLSEYDRAIRPSEKALGGVDVAALDGLSDPSYVTNYLSCLRRCIRVKVMAGHHEAAEECFLSAQNTVDQICDAARQRPGLSDKDRANLFWHLAWTLTARPEESLHRPPKAIALSKQAIELGGKSNSEYWETLGLAHYRNGERQQAIDTLLRREQLFPRERSFSGKATLAMAYLDVGNPEEARRQLEMAIRSRANVPRVDQGMNLLLEEAQAKIAKRKGDGGR